MALETDGAVNVFDIWASQDHFDAFGATLLPILGELGVDPGPPMIANVIHMIMG